MFAFLFLFLLLKILYKDWVNIFVVWKFSNNGWPACDDNTLKMIPHTTIEQCHHRSVQNFHQRFCWWKVVNSDCLSVAFCISSGGLDDAAPCLGCIKISITEDKQNSGWDWAYQSSREPQISFQLLIIILSIKTD